MLYLIDEPLADLGYRVAARDDDAQLLLVQDGVLLDPDLNVPTYAIERDVAIRGVELPARIESVTYDEAVSLIFAQEVTSFV